MSLVLAVLAVVSLTNVAVLAAFTGRGLLAIGRERRGGRRPDRARGPGPRVASTGPVPRTPGRHALP